MSRYKPRKKLSEVQYSHTLSDSHVAIKALSSYLIDSKMIWECQNKLNEVGKKNMVFSIWVSVHSGIKGNKDANTLVKEGSRMSLIGPEPFCGICKCTYKKEFLEKEKAEKLWWNLPGMEHSTEFLRNFETAGSKRYLDLGKKQLHLLAGFLTGHCHLRKEGGGERNPHSPSHGMPWHCEPK